MPNDGNLVIYVGSTAKWASNTVGRGRHAIYQKDGNLAVYNSSNRAVCGAGTVGNSNCIMVLYSTAGSRPTLATRGSSAVDPRRGR